MNDEVARLKSLLGTTALNGFFRSIEIAEQAMEAGGNPDGAFSKIQPTEALRGKATWLYRRHCDEIIQRVRDGEDTRPGTLAEVLAGLMEAATKAPLNEDARAAVAWLWKTLAPQSQYEAVAGLTETPYTPDGIERVVAETRRRLTAEWRR